MSIDLETRRKRLAYRANYRGFREADMMLGGFAKDHGADLTEEEINQFEWLIEESDHNIYDWLSGAKPLPAQHDTPLFHRIKAYKPV